MGTHIAPLNTASTHYVVDPGRNKKLLLNKKEFPNYLIALTKKVTHVLPYQFIGKSIL
jgi:SsrA-binding protein